MARSKILMLFIATLKTTVYKQDKMAYDGHLVLPVPLEWCMARVKLLPRLLLLLYTDIGHGPISLIY